MGWDDHVPCTCTHRTHHLYSWVGGVGGVGWDDHVPCTCTHPSGTHPLYSWVGGVGGVWDDHVPCTCTHPSRTHHVFMITYLALALTLAEHIPCIHGWVGWVGWDDHVPCTGWLGWVGWGDDHVPCTCTHPSRTHPLYSWVGGVGGVGWDDHVPCTCTHLHTP